MLNLDNNTSGRFFVQTYNDDTNNDFVNRQKSVFEKLDAVVKDNEQHAKRQTKKRHIVIEDTISHKKQRNDTRQFRGQESIFKRPEAPPPSRIMRNIPDFKRNPQKWTKYTLSDVSQEDMSDRSNTAAAMAFLQELKAKRESELIDVDIEEKPITFRKPSTFKESETKNCVETTGTKYESPSFRLSSKVVMPEYVVGEKKAAKKCKRQIVCKTGRPKEIKLDHLDEDDEYCEG